MHLETKRNIWITLAILCGTGLVFLSLAERSLNIPCLLATFLVSIQVGRFENACEKKERRRRRIPKDIRFLDPPER